MVGVAGSIWVWLLHRFDFNSLFGGKINKNVSYEEHLNIRPYMSDNKVCH